MPMALTHHQQAALFLAARPLEPHQRAAFRAAVAAELNGCTDPGDGELHRIIRKVQSQFFDPPTPLSESGALLRP
jgi:hypothetical protein